MIEYMNNVRAIVDVRWNTRVKRDEFRIVGTEGEIDLTPLYGPELVYPGGREELPTHANIHFPCIENYVAAVLDGAQLISSGASALRTDWVTEQAVASSALSHASAPPLLIARIRAERLSYGTPKRTHKNRNYTVFCPRLF